LAECLEVRRIGNAGQHLLEVGGILLAVLWRVQNAIDVIKDVFLGDRLVVVVLAEVGQCHVGNAVTLDIAIGVGGACLLAIKTKATLWVGVGSFFIPMQREAL